MNKFSYVLSLVVLFASNLSHAQTWQWGKRGGSADNAGSGLYETVLDMAADSKGNSYVLSHVYKTALGIDGTPKTGYGNNDILVSSFSCNGTLRWVKNIGGFSGDLGRALKVDSLGGVYVLGTVLSNNASGYVHFDADTSLGNTQKRLFLLKYDTSGNYKWLRMFEPDTVTLAGSASRVIDLAVDDNGNSYVLSYLYPGAFANGGFINNNLSIQILRYNSQGQYLGNTPLPISGSLTQIDGMKLTRDNKSGKYYIQGGFLSLNGTTYANNFLAAFAASGSFLWARQVTGNMGFFGRIGLGHQGLMYVTGYCYPGDTFNGYTVPASVYNGAPMLIALDTNGTANAWVMIGAVNGGTSGDGVAVKNGEVAIIGHYPGKLKWPGTSDSLQHIPNQGYDVFITRFNANTGAYIKQDSIGSPGGFDDFPSVIIADRNGNYLVGGEFGSQISVAGVPLISIGGETDFFVAKYGSAVCGCTVPVAGYSASINPTTKVGAFTYTGTGQADSLRWNFGDGTTSSQANPTHTFATGHFNVCVTAYNSCGSNQYCSQVSLSVAGLAALGNVRVYPNPASDYLVIEGMEDGSYSVMNTIGQRVAQGVLTINKTRLDIGSLMSGMYVLQLSNSKGNRGAMTFVKQ